jgi:hypothetical protein
MSGITLVQSDRRKRVGLLRCGSLKSRVERHNAWTCVFHGCISFRRVFFRFGQLGNHSSMKRSPSLGRTIQSKPNFCPACDGPEIIKRGLRRNSLRQLRLYTVEFGLIREAGDIKVCGSGIIPKPRSLKRPKN